MSKVIRDCIGFALLRSVISLENSRHPLSQSDAKLKPILTWSLAFSRASSRLHVPTLSSDWFLMIFSFVLIGRCDYFGSGFTTLNLKALYSPAISDQREFERCHVFVLFFFFSGFTTYALRAHRAIRVFSFFSQHSLPQSYAHGRIGLFLYLVHSGKQETTVRKLLSNLWKIWTFRGGER